LELQVSFFLLKSKTKTKKMLNIDITNKANV
jgi:hypothetical protein